MSVINTNVKALYSQNSLVGNNRTLSTAMERLSTGVRINSAKDDAAGLAITSRLTAEIRGLSQAVRNTNDAISMMQTAEGALGEIGSVLQRLRELANQSVNASNNAQDRVFIQAEATALIDEVTRIGTQTNWNTINLLDGTFTNQIFQVGAKQGETITVTSIANSRATALGTNSIVMNGTITGVTKAAAADISTDNTVAAEDNLTLSTANGGTTAAISYAQHADAKEVAAAINAAVGTTGITAVATNSATLGGLVSAGTVSMTLNGQAISAVIGNSTDLTALAASINGQTVNTGVTASFASPTNMSTITLTTNDGRDIGILDFNHDGTTKTVAFQQAEGAAVTLTGAGNDSSIATGIVTLTSSKGAITAQNANADVFATEGTVNNSLTAVSAVDLTTVSTAATAVTTLGNAINQISDTRATLGAFMNRFAAAISNQNTAVLHLSESRSRINDADYAAESTNLAKAQIVNQAATAMLAQANQQAQSVLALLQ